MFCPEKDDMDDTYVHIECKRGDRLVPIYEEPLSTYCVLPGGLYYLYIRKPGKQTPRDIAMAEDDYVR